MKSKPTKAHFKVYRAIEGAVRNVAYYHPDWSIKHRDVSNSIAKRATGTLTAAWSDVLAARMEPSNVNDYVSGSHWPPSRVAISRGGRGNVGASRRSPNSLLNLWNEVSSLINPAKRDKNTERVNALIDVLRIIDERIKNNQKIKLAK